MSASARFCDRFTKAASISRELLAFFPKGGSPKTGHRSRHDEPPWFATLNLTRPHRAIAQESRFQGLGISWLLNWNVRWFCPAQDPVDHLRGAAVQTRKVWPVRHQAASLAILSYAYHCRQARSQCQNDDAHAMHVQHRVAGDIDCICMSLERLKRGHDILALPDLRRNNLKAEPARYRLNLI